MLSHRVDDVRSVADEADRRLGRGRRSLRQYSVPVRIAVRLVGFPASAHLDPFLGDDRAVLPLAVAEEQVAKRAMSCGVDEHAATPVAAAMTDWTPCRRPRPTSYVAVPAPRGRGADQSMTSSRSVGQLAPDLQRRQHHDVHAHVVVLEVRARLWLPVRPVLGFLADRPIGSGLPTACPASRWSATGDPFDLLVVRRVEQVDVRRHVVARSR